MDMNLSPEWLTVLEQAGWQARHWSAVGSPTAADTDLLDWARQYGWVVMTQDLDFAEVLFHTQAGAPSVVMLRQFATNWIPRNKPAFARCYEPRLRPWKPALCW